MNNNQFITACQNFPVLAYLAEHGQKVRDSGGSVRIDCPHCGGRKTLSVAKNGRGCQCFRCSEGGFGGSAWKGYGSLADLIVLLEGVQKRVAVERILEYADEPNYSYTTTSPQEAQEPRPPGSLPLTAAGPNHAARATLRARGLGHLEDRVWLCLEGRYTHRWILPIWEMGKEVGWEAKTYAGGKPKSLLPSWFRSGEHIYTTLNWNSDRDFFVVTESIFDAETIGWNAVGIFGSALREGQFSKFWELRRQGHTRIVWFLDEDAWKKQAAAILGATRTWFDNYVVDLHKGDDPNSLGYAECWDRIGRARVVSNSFDLLARPTN